MRRVVVCGVLLLLGLIRVAFATDYDLTIEPGSKGLLKEHSLTLYQQFGLVKPGDRIVSITVGALPNPNITCRLWAGVGANSVVLVPKGTLRKFQGEIRLGTGDPGTNSVGAALLMHVIPGSATAPNGSILQNTTSYLGTHPFILIGPGILLLIGVVVAFLRINAPAPGSAPLYGKRAYEENVREVKDKLERIMEAQEVLVRKPPVLRSFRKQIDRFDKRLEKLEVTSVSSQQALSVIASSVVDLQKHLDDLASRNEVAQQAIDNLHTRLASQTEDAKKSASSLREDLRAQDGLLKHSVAEIGGQIQSQSQKLEALGKSLSGEIRAVSDAAKAASQEANARIDAQSQRVEASATAVSAEFAAIQEHLAQAEKNMASLGEALSGEVGLSAGRAEQIQQSFNAILAQFQGLAPLPANVSELHGRVGNLKADLSSMSEKLVASTAEMGDFQRTSLLSFADLEEKVSNLKGAMSEIGVDLSKLQSEIDVSRSVSEATSATLADVAKSVDSVRETAVTRDQIAKLHAEVDTSRALGEGTSAAVAEIAKSVDSVRESTATRDQVSKLVEVPAAIEALRNNLNGLDSRLKEAGISKEDGKRILTAHEKLGSMPGEVSQAIQRALEQKLTAMMAQSFAPKKGKEAEGSGIADRGASALAEVAQQLIAEIEHQKNLEQTLEAVLAKIEAVPVALEKIDERLANVPTPTAIPAEAPVIPVAEMMSLIAETKEAVSGVPTRIDGIEKGLGEVSAKWEEASGKLERATQQVVDLANAPRYAAPVSVPPAAAVETKKSVEVATAETAPEKPIEASAEDVRPKAKVSARKDEAPSKTEEAIPTVPNLILEEAFELPSAVEVKSTPAAPEPLEVSEMEAPPESEELVVAQLPEPEEEKPEVIKPAAVKRLASDEWLAATGNLRGTFAAETPRDLILVNDPDTAKRPLTPTETPGIEYQIGPMLCAHSKVIYVHGDSIRAFWPGGNERSILLASSVPEDQWRLLLMGEHLFCAQEKRVEIIDTGNWTKSGSFTGEYLAQSGCGENWAGVRGGPIPVLDFRDMDGDPIGKAVDLEKSFNELLPALSDGKHVWVASKSGTVIKARPGTYEPFCDLPGSKQGLAHFLLSACGPVAILNEAAGLSIKRLDEKGKIAKEVLTNANQTSGNVVAMGNRLYFFDPEQSELAVCDLEKMELVDAIPLPGIVRVRRIVGFGAGRSEVLMIAGSDAGGKLGSVFLLDPENQRQYVLCSTNQPHVDAIFSAGYAIVATSSSYQNIIRVFQPFRSAEESGRAA